MPTKMPGWIFGIVILLLVLCILISGLVYYRAGSQVILGEMTSELNSVVQLKADQVVQWREERLNDVNVQSSSPIFVYTVQSFIQNPNDQAVKRRLEEHLQLLSQHYDYRAVYLVDQDANLVIASNGDQAVSTIDLQLAQQALQSNETVMGRFFREADSEGIFIDMAAPINLGEISENYAIIFRSDPREYLFSGIEKALTLSETIDTALLRVEGERVRILNRVKHDTAAPMTREIPVSVTDSFFVQAVIEPSGSIVGKDLNGDMVRAEAVRIPESNWAVVSFIPETDIHARIRQLQLSVGSFVLLSIVITLILAVYLYGRRQRKLYQRMLEAELEKANTQEEIKATLYSIGDGVITTDATGVVMRMNPIAEKLTGWKEQEAHGKPLAEVFRIINENSRQVVESPVEKVLREGIVIGLANHTMLIKKDGAQVPIADSGAPIQGSDGKITGVVLVFRDQTEEREKQKAHFRLVEAMRASRNEIFVFDADDLLFQFVNDSALSNLGYTLEELQGMTPLDIKPEISRTDFMSILKSLKTGAKKVEIFETIHQRADGSQYPVEVFLQYIENPYDRVFMAVIQDITETESMRKAIQHEQERYYFLVEQSPEAILLTREGEITYVNQAAIRLFGAEKADDLIGRTSTSLATSDFHQLIDERRSILLGDGQPVPLVEEKIIRLDGSTCDVEVATVALGELDEKAIQVTLRDITERKHAQEQLKEQLLELRRWHAVTLDREQRVLDLKAEINDLLVKDGKEPRYQVTT